MQVLLIVTKEIKNKKLKLETPVRCREVCHQGGSRMPTGLALGYLAGGASWLERTAE